MKNLIALIALSMGLAHAGEHVSKKDSFTGDTQHYYQSTKAEFSKNKVYFRVDKDADGLYWMSVGSPNKVTNCSNNFILFKRPDGVIYQKGSKEIDNRICVFQVIPESIQGVFEIRLPIYRGPSIDAKFDGSNFNPERMVATK
jgi:hypothetical protein